MKCLFFEQCPHVNSNSKASKEYTITIEQWCSLGYKNNCAIYMVLASLGADFVPPHLFPDNIEMAVDIIREQLRINNVESSRYPHEEGGLND